MILMNPLSAACGTHGRPGAGPYAFSQICVINARSPSLALRRYRASPKTGQSTLTKRNVLRKACLPLPTGQTGGSQGGVALASKDFLC